mmetsp:Transcript_31426/g.101612  ORF Transcript_31426/g.101612 Transcript_31426/m.101612 type:complete len:232 (-) Transcript_31426:541-1236(-)|eukprot:scaffold15992_cov118-Isochrysis_galbana.AAC.3
MEVLDHPRTLPAAVEGVALRRLTRIILKDGERRRPMLHRADPLVHHAPREAVDVPPIHLRVQPLSCVVTLPLQILLDRVGNLVVAQLSKRHNRQVLPPVGCELLACRPKLGRLGANGAEHLLEAAWLERSRPALPATGPGLSEHKIGGQDEESTRGGDQLRVFLLCPKCGHRVAAHAAEEPAEVLIRRTITQPANVVQDKDGFRIAKELLRRGVLKRFHLGQVGPARKLVL